MNNGIKKSPVISIKTHHKFSQHSSSNPVTPKKADDRHQSPFRYVNEMRQTTDLPPAINEFLSKLIFIFMYYTSYGDKLNISFLKSSKFHKILIDAKIETDYNKIVFELMFSSICKAGSMNFRQFLNSLPKIAPIIYPDMPLNKALETLLNSNIIVLYNYIEQYMENNAMGYAKEDIQIPPQVIAIMQSIDKPLYDIYTAYYPFELSNTLAYHDRYEQSMAATFTLLYDFDICPSMISKPSAFYIYQSLINKEACIALTYVKHVHQGKLLTYPKFLEYLIKIAISSRSLSDQAYTERIELSNGFNNLEKKTAKVPTSFTSLLPSQELMNKSATVEDRSSVDEVDIPDEKMPNRSPSTHGSYAIEPNAESVLSKYRFRLQSIFEHYCSYGESSNITKLKCAKFIKLLRDAELVKPLKEDKLHTKYPLLSSTADIIFSQFSTILKMSSPDKLIIPGMARPRTGTLYSTNSMNFKQFQGALCLISSKIYLLKKRDEAVQILLDNYILKLEIFLSVERVVKNKNIVQILDISKDNELGKIIELLRKSFSPFFRFYCSNKITMNIASFIKFCTDFEIFPSLCSKQFLVRLFATLSNLQVTSGGNKNSISEAYIDEIRFMQGIVLCGLEISYSPINLSKEEKILRLVEKMSHSKGVTKVMIANGTTKFLSGEYDLLKNVKNEFPHLFIPDEQPEQEENLFVNILTHKDNE